MWAVIFIENISFWLKCQFSVNRAEQGFWWEEGEPLAALCCSSACSDAGVHAATFWNNCPHCKTEAYKLGLCNLVTKLTDLCTYSCRFKYFIIVECKAWRSFLCYSSLKSVWGEQNEVKKDIYTHTQKSKKGREAVLDVRTSLALCRNSVVTFENVKAIPKLIGTCVKLQYSLGTACSLCWQCGT